MGVVTAQFEVAHTGGIHAGPRLAREYVFQKNASALISMVITTVPT